MLAPRDDDTVDDTVGDTVGDAGRAPFPGRAHWYLNRLRCMSPAEIAHRTGRAVRIHAERLGLAGRGRAPRPDPAPVQPWAARVIDTAHTKRYIAAADRVAAGRLDVFALSDIDMGSPPRWNRDPSTGIEAPLVFGKLLDYRNPEIVGDIKYLWEPNRHLQLVTPAQAYALEGDARHAEAMRSQLESWLDACPYRYGPNWSSSLEPALRLINWSIAWQLIGGLDAGLFATDAGMRFRERWLESVYQHAAFIRGHFSLYSSANNHLIGEAAGLLVAAASWPHWNETSQWLAEAHRILERELRRQNAPDGVNREQAVGYQLFELDLVLVAVLAGRAAGLVWSSGFMLRLEAMLEYLASIMDSGGQVPGFGDSDDGFAVRLSQEPGFCPYRSLLAGGAILFDRPDFKRKAERLDDKVRWLFGTDADARFARLESARAPRQLRRTFPDGGYYVLGTELETEREIRLVADTGPLGYGAIAAHGHADALSFTLSMGGRELLVDPGTYTYRSDSPWRGYFRGSAAHNTVRIDGRDQSEPGGTFMWLRKTNAACTMWDSSEELDVLEGWHDGYLHLPEPVRHRRRIVLDKRWRRIFIEDRLETSGIHDVDLLFHCSERCRVRATENGLELRNGPALALLRLPGSPEGSTAVHCGSVNPRFGWRSPRFGVILAAPTIHWHARLGNAVLRTEIQC